MKALVFSDSHGKLDGILEVMKRHPDFEAIFHLGDIGNDFERMRLLTPYPVYIVRGNCDYTQPKLKENLVVEFCGRRIAMCHGHRYLTIGDELDSLRYFGLQNKADIVMFGHTHVPLLDEQKDITLLNPGSISKPRQISKIPTYAIMEADEGGNVTFQMCEL